MMRTASLCCLVLIALGACGRRSGLYADRTVPPSPSATVGGVPRFVGRWAASNRQCGDPWVIQARSLKAGPSDCDFDKVESDSAGYTVAAVCRSSAGPRPARLSIVAPNQPRISILTISGGPFRDPVPLQRCAAQ